MSLTLLSPAFEHRQSIPREFTPEGHDRSPPLSWLGQPENCRAYALICDDPDAPGGTYTHWLIYDIPGELGEVPAGLPKQRQLEGPLEAKQGVNDANDIGWAGPHPPLGDGVHRYRFTLYALDRPVGLRPGANRAELEGAIRQHVLEQCTLIGLYEREAGTRFQPGPA